jgi:hypothetical protein
MVSVDDDSDYFPRTYGSFRWRWVHLKEALTVVHAADRARRTPSQE